MTAGYALPFHVSYQESGDVLNVSMLALTKKGTVKFTSTSAYSLDTDHALFLVKPLPPDDPNFNRIDWTI